MFNVLDSFKKLNIYGKISLLLIIILPWLLIFQGLNHIDEGFIITNFHYFFSNPESINYGFTHYFTDFIGSLWGSLFPKLGIIRFRIGWIVEIYLIFILSFSILKKFLDKNIIFVGLLLAFLFTNNVDTINRIHYSYTTTLFYLSSIFFLLFGLLKNKTHFLFYAGLLFGINSFVRLPNVVFVLCFLFIPAYYIFFQKDGYNLQSKIKSILVKTLSFIGGFFLSLGSMLFVIYHIGHLHLFMDTINMVFGMAKEGIETRNHGLSYLLFVYLKSFFFVFLISGLTGLYCFLILKIRKYFKKNIHFYGSVILGIILGIVSILKFYFVYNIFGLNFFVSYISFLFPFLVIITYLYVVFYLKLESKYKFLFFVSLVFLLTVQIGSGGYLEMMQNAGFLSFPLILYLLYSNVNMSDFFKKIIQMFFIIIFTSSLISTIYVIYRNNENVFYKNNLGTYKLGYINVDRSLHDEFIEIANFLKSQKTDRKLLYLSNFGEGSYFYYMFDITPFLGNSVPAYYPIETYKILLEKELNKDNIPIIFKYKYKNIEKNNSFRQHGENLEKVTFDVVSKKGIVINKCFETENFIFFK